MQIIKLNATDSTNVYLKELMLHKSLEDGTTVVAREQWKGRGQMGAIWESEAGKNLTFSVLKKCSGLPIADQFRLHIYTSMAIVTTLKALNVPDITIKWPNDILSGTSKICGILIENILLGTKIQSTIIGIGLNVNQCHFPNLTNVSSLKLLLGRAINLEEMLMEVLANLDRFFLQSGKTDASKLWAAYEQLLFRKGRPSTFENANGERFMGFIEGVSRDGKLRLVLEDQITKEFDLKELKLLY